MKWGISIVVITMLGAFWFFGYKQSQWSESACANCGQIREVHKKSLWGIAYFSRDDVRESEISKQLQKLQVQTCPHRWFIVNRSVSHKRLSGGGAIGCSMGGLGVRTLLNSTDFWTQGGPSTNFADVWRTFAMAYQADSRATENFIGEELFADDSEIRNSIDAWWIHGNARMIGIARGVVPNGMKQ